MALLEVNGQPVNQHFDYLRSVFAGSSSERLVKNIMLVAVLQGGFLPMPRTLGLVDFDGRHFAVTLSPRETTPPPNLRARRLASGFGYIKFGQWRPPVDEEFRRELANLSDAPALVIDLRGNGGGEARVLLDIASNFFHAPTYYGGFRNRAGELRRHYTHPPARLYEGALAVLVDEVSASASESFSIFMQESGRARIVGRQSAGSTLNLTGGERSFKGGGKLFSARTPTFLRAGATLKARALSLTSPCRSRLKIYARDATPRSKRQRGCSATRPRAAPRRPTASRRKLIDIVRLNA